MRGTKSKRVSGGVRVSDWYKETEKLIASYWRLKDRIARLEAVEASILDTLDALNAELREAKSIPSYTSKYGILPPSARSQDRDYSDFLAQVESQVDKLSEQILAKRKHLTSIQYRLQRAREMVAPLEVVMARLTEEERRITELRYVHRWSYWAIGTELHKSKTRIFYAHRTIILKVAEWLGKTERKRNAIS